MTDFLQLAHDRYSVRAFSDRPVEAEKIDALVDAAVAAPTAVNKQPWHLWVVESPEAVERLSGLTRFSFGARVILMLGARADEAWVRKYDGRNFADVDASIVGTHIMLAAHDLGLGTTWVGHFNRARRARGLPGDRGLRPRCPLSDRLSRRRRLACGAPLQQKARFRACDESVSKRKRRLSDKSVTPG